MDPYGASSRLIERAWEAGERSRPPEARAAVAQAIALLDRGEIRVAEKHAGAWRVNGWVQMAILLYFRQHEAMRVARRGRCASATSVPVKQDLAARRVRVVPPGTVRYGSFLEPDVGAHARLRQHRRLRRRGHDDRHLGDGRQLRADRPRRACLGRRRDRRRARAARRRCRSSSRTAPSSARAACGRGRARRRARGARRRLRPDRVDSDRRRARAAPVVTRGAIPPGVVVIPGSWPRRFPAGRVPTPVRPRRRRAERTRRTRKTRSNEVLREYPLRATDDGGNAREVTHEAPAMSRRAAARRRKTHDRPTATAKTPGCRPAAAGAGRPRSRYASCRSTRLALGSCDHLDQFPFETTAELPGFEGIIGQDRAIEAIRLGLEDAQQGLQRLRRGRPGTGRTTTVQAPARDGRHRPGAPRRHRLREQLPRPRPAARAPAAGRAGGAACAATWRSSSSTCGATSPRSTRATSTRSA